MEIHNRHTIKAILLIFCSCFGVTVAAQNYQTGSRSVTFIDAARNNRNITVDLFYPGSSSGSNVPLVNGTEKFPVVVFGHGFVINTTSYNWLADSLVKNGFIVALPSTESSFSPDHEGFGRDLAFLCNHIVSLSDSVASFLFGRVKNRKAVGGHSMGGGASFLATNYNNSINAIFNFAAAETNPSAKQAAQNTQIPALIFAGSSDCIVPDSNQQRMYTNIPYACKTFVNISNALHCHFANNNATCATGQFFSGCNSSPVTAQNVFDKTTQLIVPFLNYYLKDSCGSKVIFENTLNNIPGITKERQCTTDPFVCNTATVYTFTGNGNWDVPGNWLNNTIPPSALLAGSEIVIASSGTCILNVPQTITTGAKLTVNPGKNLLVQGNLIVQ